MKPTELRNIVNKQLKTDALIMGNDPSLKVSYLPTGVEPFDDLLVGGIPLGRSVVVYGAFSTLKTYIGLNAIREAQQRGHSSVLVDTEHTYEPEWAEHIGINTSDLILLQPETGEEAIDITETLVRAKTDLIVFDSVAATLPQDEAKKRLKDENTQPARQAALMSKALRKLTAANRNTGILWINQLREKVGVTFGSSESFPGGRALPFYASYMVKVSKADAQREEAKYFIENSSGKYEERTGKRTVAQNVRLSVEKSKLNVPHGEVYFTFDLNTGTVDIQRYLIGKCLQQGIIRRNGGWWHLDGQKYRQDELKAEVTVEELRRFLSPGKPSRARSKEGSPKNRRSKLVVPRSTR